MALHYQAAIPRDRSNRTAYEFDRIEVRPIAGALGAEIGGVDLSRPLDDDTVAEIRQALLNHLGIFFRDQDITPEQHKALGLRFGELSTPDFVGGLDSHPATLQTGQETCRKRVCQ